MAGGAVGFELDEIGFSVPDFPHVGDPVPVLPRGRAGQRVREPFDVDFPIAQLEVEIVRAVLSGRRGWLLCARRGH
jgi:hypothetical protein